MSKKTVVGLLLALGLMYLAYTGVNAVLRRLAPTRITAMEAYDVAQRDMGGQFEGAYLVGLEGGFIPSTGGGDVVARVPGGEAISWTLAFYLPREHSYLDVTVKGNETEIERTNLTEVFVYHRIEITPELWKVDSSEAFEIAKQVAEESGKGEYRAMTMELIFPLTDPVDPIWDTTFFPPHLSAKTIAFWVWVNARTGEVMKTGESEYKYMPV